MILSKIKRKQQNGPLLAETSSTLDDEVNKPRIIFALQVLGQPRNAKRISMLQGVGFDIEVIAFERPYHQGRLPSCPIQTVGKIDHGHYTKRLWKMLAALPAIRRAIKSHDLIYASGADMAMICLLSNLGLGRPIVFEIADIRSLQTSKGLKGLIIRTIDKWVTNSCDLMVVTAQGYVDGYYRQWLNTKTPALVIENKLEPTVDDAWRNQAVTKNMEGTPLVDRPLRIGYFGLLRCAHSWNVLEKLAATRLGDIEIVVAGLPVMPPDISERIKKHSNIEFRGQYSSPMDLPALYCEIDIIWACYPFPKPDEQNWRWARTNRFYESCYYKKPMIVLEGSGDAEAVCLNGIGIVVPDAKIDDVIKVLSEIESKQLAVWQENIVTLPMEIYTYTSEIDDLKIALINIAAS